MFDSKMPGDIAGGVGVRLRALRLQRNITQGALAAQAGISRPTLAALESGHGSLATLARVMYALGREAELDTLAPPDPSMTLDEALSPPRRQRARS